MTPVAVKDRPLTQDERFEYLALALGLCDECRRDLKQYVRQSGRDFADILREEVWNWFGEWAHGAGCPPAA